MKISKHFTLKELSKSQTAIRMGIENSPSPQVIANATLTAEKILEPIREHFGSPFSPNSWFRSEQLERHLCDHGYRNWCTRKGYDAVTTENWKEYFALKQHPQGMAVDIELPLDGVSNDSLFQWIIDNLEFDMVIREFARPDDPNSGWVHVSYDEGKNRMQDFKIE